MASKYIGTTFGELTVLDSTCTPSPSGKSKQRFTVRCSCGTVYTLGAKTLLGVNGVRMCRGCAELKYQVRRDDNKNHPLYNTWRTMIKRCTLLTNHKYPSYGARGIAVCPEWLGARPNGEVATVDGFRQFCKDMGSRPDGRTLDRRDNDGIYEPGNCRWVCAEVQYNNRRSSVNLTVDGETHTLAQWGRMFGVDEDWYVYARERNLPLETAARKLLYGGGIGRSKYQGKNPRQLVDTEDE